MMTHPLNDKAVEVGEKYRHKKRGSTYAVVGIGELQCGECSYDGEEIVIYRGDDGRYWVRPRTEFEDGRFEFVSNPTTTEE